MLGAGAVWVGTRFILTDEAGAPKAHQEAVRTSGFDDNVRTIIFTVSGLYPHPQQAAPSPTSFPPTENSFTPKNPSPPKKKNLVTNIPFFLPLRAAPSASAQTPTSKTGKTTAPKKSKN